jgi:hypothetical protein
VKELVALLRRGPAAAGLTGLVEAARGEMDPRKIQALSSQAMESEIIRHHHIMPNAADLVPSIQGLIDAGADYVIFADESRKHNDTMRKLVTEVIPHLRERS